MELKAFKKGAKAYMLNRRCEKIEEVFVVKVGRKYIYTAKEPDAPEWGWTSFKQTDHNCTGKNILPYLEETDWNGRNRSLLFKNEAAIQEYRERQELEKWFIGFRENFYISNSLTTEQMRKIKAIVDGDS